MQYIRDRLEKEGALNDNQNLKFVHNSEIEENFMQLTERLNIDYQNLGDFMDMVYQEFLKMLDSKK